MWVFKRLDGDYTTNTLKKDIVSSVQSVQKAGFIVTSHAVERDEDATGSFETHSVRIVPIEGAPSMVRFRTVNIDDRGRIEVGAPRAASPRPGMP